ncbi:KpsF/GutQ family sugar-phosphate isomerase [Gammaproteobacteria bacterium]|nr:KpsF/GutQ family sugar-phosphate isomerase [Gammaproteobacteria bacterium]
MDKSALKKSALRTIELELSAVASLSARIDDSFFSACELILNCQGRIIVMGMGKSGHIANKIAATLASTGTPAHFVHPAEASHGDIGMVTAQDIVIAISNSGTTAEIETILPVLKRKGVPLISLTGNPVSLLAREATANLDASVEQEACPLGLAPTTSTTAALVMGDALAMALLEARGFTAEDFAFSHPGGNLGRRLLLKVSDIMHTGNDIPRVSEDTSVRDSLLEISAKKLGMTTISNSQGEICGVFTDGDLRRFLDGSQDIKDTCIKDVMTNTFKSISGNSLASEAAKIMQDNEIYTLLVIDDKENFYGIVTMHDLLKANVV